MRTEEEMYGLIIHTAREDERIRAVYMNGSRTNPNVPKDIFQDYDIVYVVTDTKPFYEEEAWIDVFGKRLYMQTPEKMDRLMGQDVSFQDTYGWLMQLADGNRIDLHVESIAYAKKHILEDKLCRILLDKDDLLPEIPESTEENYYVKKPGENEFRCCCNEFWWCMNNVAKGLWREEIPYAHQMVDFYVRPQLVKLLSWKIGLGHNFSCSIGKAGKYLHRYLEKECWERFLGTYADGTAEHCWEAARVMCDLFHETAGEVADRLGFSYDTEEACQSRRHMEHVRMLPRDAQEVY